MTESEFLSCNDPGWMLTWRMRSPNMSDDKLRLFAVACHEPDQYWRAWGQSGHKRGTSVLRAAKLSAGLDDDGAKEDLSRDERSRRAAILRCLIGNPFRPSTWSPPSPLSGIGLAIRQMAEAAYAERTVRKCDNCQKWQGVRTDGEGYYEMDAAQAVIDFGNRKRACVCKGTGLIDDGALDPHRLAILADACLDAGCADEWLLRHLRGEEPVFQEMGGPAGQVVRTSLYRLVGWRLLTTPHYRGCFGIDRLISKE